MRDFAKQELWPNAARWDKEHHFPKEAHQGLAALGAYGICVPEEFGGANLDYLTLALVLEEIAAGDGGTSTAISVTNCPVNAILMRYGNAQQKKRWLMPLAQGQLLGAFCLTEPHVGSDASSLRTTAEKDGDGYVINPRDTQTDKLLARRASHHANLSADTRLGRWLVGGGVQLSGARYDTADNTTVLPGYAVANLHVSTKIDKDWSVLARIDNLTDSAYQLASGYATSGRSLYVALKWAPLR